MSRMARHRRNHAFSRRLRKWVRIDKKPAYFLFTHDIDLDTITINPKRIKDRH